MSYSGTGAFVINSAGQPAVSGVVISSTVHNALTADLATGLSTCICKDGQTTTTARIVFAQGISSTLATDATSTTTGSIITAGGISCVKALWVGGLVNITGAVTLASTLTATGDINSVGGVIADTALQTKGGIVYLGATAAATLSMIKTDGGLISKFRKADDSGYATVDAGAYKVAGAAGVDFGPAAVASITIVKGIVTACS
jgi:hypothetical protein